jgi:L-alanine-DL-glutamate epimerase-like enolase superfamily enzyme
LIDGIVTSTTPARAQLGGGASDRAIRACTTRVVTRKMARAEWNPRSKWNEKNVVLAFLTLDDGTVGVGEAYCDGGTTASVQAIIERDLAPLLIGQTPLGTRHLWHAMIESGVVSAKAGACYAAASALDIAIWDLAGKILGLPVHRLLGGHADRVSVYASGGLYGEGKSRDDLAREMAGYVALGFRAVKLKVGGATIAEDVARVMAVREAIGTEVRLMVDALYSYSPAEALRFAHAAAPCDVHFFEAPVHPEDIEGLQKVCARSPIPVAGNEFAYSAEVFRRILDAGIDVVHADAILCGGISGALRVADLAAAHHRPISFHAASSAVCLAANAHVAAAASNSESVEFHMIHQLLFDLDPMPFRLEQGDLLLEDRPGLGLEIDADLLP